MPNWHLNHLLEIRKQLVMLLFSFIVGSVLSVIICPYLIFNPTDINYLRLDEGQHFFGWAFFRQDTWHWPLTVTNRLMYPVGTSIVFTDSYPFLALLLKLLSPLLPATFVFHGVVLIINLSLMYYASNLLLRIITQDPLFSIIGSFFFVFATPFIFRFSASHAALASHWIIILGFIPFFVAKEQQLAGLRFIWGLVLLSIGIHLYLTSMLVILLFAYTAQLLYFSLISKREVVKTSLIGTLCAPVLMYLLGYFYNFGSGQSAGFGLYCANLTALINPLLDSSTFFPSIDQPQVQVGGYAYLGLGVFLMVGIAVYYLCSRRSWNKKLIPLYLALIGSFLFSLSNNIYWGNILILHFDLSNFALFNIFRASNRYIWLLYYSILIFCLVALYNIIGQKKRRNFLLVLFLFVQLLDTYPLIIRLHDAFLPKKMGYEYALDRKFWFSLGEKYKHMQIDINFVGQFNNDLYGNAHIYKLANIAVKNNLTLNVFYLARTSVTNEEHYLDDYRGFLQGKIQPDTVYIMSEKTMQQTVGEAKNEYCKAIDGYYVCGYEIRSSK